MAYQQLALLSLFVNVALSASLPWWKSSILYQIYPRSFVDSDGDGNGDIKGITSQIPYLKDLGVGIVWLSPIFASPGKDMGYDVSDYQAVNPMFGTMQDVEELIKEVHKYGMKLFLDFVPNHTSNEHPWFNSSVHRQDGKEDFYVWKKPKTWEGTRPVPPNNWGSIFGGDAWTYEPKRRQFYLHQFGYFQPDLNYRNHQVMLSMQENMNFWFKKGIDGFRVDAIPFLVEDEGLRDEPEIPNCTDKNIRANCLIHKYTQNQPETYDRMKEFDDFLEQYDSTTPRYLFLEAYADLNQTLKYYQKHSSPFNFQFISLKKETNATQLKQIIDTYMENINDKRWPNWVTGNHDNSRVGTRMGPEMVDAMNMLVLLLPGSSVTYQGEEIGMLDTFVRKDQTLDTTGRDPERTPMQWNQKKNAGFSNGTKTWLPVNPNYYALNVEVQNKSDSSHIERYKRLASVRKDFIESIDLNTTAFGDWVFGFERTLNNKKEYYVIINLNNLEEEVVLNEGFSDIPSNVFVHIPSENAGYKAGAKISTSSKIILQPRSALGLSSASSVCLSVTLAILVSAIWSYVFGKSL